MSIDPIKGDGVDLSKLLNFEKLYLEQAGAILDSSFHQACNFLGFAYRGILLRGGRKHSMIMSDDMMGKLPTENHHRFLRLLTEVYLERYGSATSMNNLVLETQYQLVSQGQPRFIQLSFGGDESRVDNTPQRRHIILSDKLVKELGGDLDIWSEARRIIGQFIDAHPGDQPYNQASHLLKAVSDCLLQADDLLHRSSWYLVRYESRLIYDLAQCTFQDGTEKSKLHTATREVLAWLRAFQGLFLFQLFGQHWITVPVRPYFKGPFELSGVSVPFSAVTTITDDPSVADHILELASRIEHAGNRELNCHFADAVTSLSESRNKAHPLVAEASHAPKFMHPQLLDLARALVQTSHEGEMLEFVFLCAPENVLLRLYRGSDSWTLVPVDKLDKTDFPQNVDTYDSVRFSILANGLILQEPGRALYFVPHDLVPREVVRFHPFDPSRLDMMLRQFTSDGSSGAAIHVRARDARLFVGGKVILRTGLNKGWEKVADALDRGNGSPLLKAILNLTWAKGLTVEACARVEAICQTIVEVAERGYGCLLFLVKGQGLATKRKIPERSPMGLVWGTGKSRRIEAVSPSYLASFAGLDGETYVDIDSGEYETRQFLLVPDRKFLKFYEADKAGQLALTQEFEKYCKRMPPIKDSPEDILRFGTRHQKALRITYAFPESTIAITVSADGPIRLWHKGYPIKKYSV